MQNSKHDRLNIPLLVSKLPLFLQLSPEEIAWVAAGTREKRLARKEMLFQKGDTPTGFYVVITGQIKLAFPSNQGAEKVVDIVGPRQSFGEALVFAERPFPVYAEALLDTSLLHISSAVVLGLLAGDPQFARRLLAGLSSRLHSLVKDVESYSLRTSTQRVIGYLLERCSQCAGHSDAENVQLPASKQVIASRLNLTPETLSRIFHNLIEADLISMSGKQIRIHNVKRLQEFDLS